MYTNKDITRAFNNLLFLDNIIMHNKRCNYDIRRENSRIILSNMEEQQQLYFSNETMKLMDFCITDSQEKIISSIRKYYNTKEYYIGNDIIDLNICKCNISTKQMDFIRDNSNLFCSVINSIENRAKFNELIYYLQTIKPNIKYCGWKDKNGFKIKILGAEGINRDDLVTSYYEIGEYIVHIFYTTEYYEYEIYHMNNIHEEIIFYVSKEYFRINNLDLENPIDFLFNIETYRINALTIEPLFYNF